MDFEKLIEIDLSLTENDADRMTVLPLGEIVQILYRHCIDRGDGLIEVKFNRKVVDVGQSESTAWADVETGDAEEGSTERLFAPYVVGCDGASSAVRKALFGRNWPGDTFPYRFIAQQVRPRGFMLHRPDANSTWPRFTMTASKSMVGMVETT